MLVEVKSLTVDYNFCCGVLPVREQAVLYVRVSSEEQESNTSLDSQERTGKEYAERNDLEIVKVWRGPESAWKNDSKRDTSDRVRRNFNEMLDYVAKNRIKHLIFDVPDRLTRNEDDKTKVRRLIKERDTVVHFARTNKKLHKYSDNDDFFMFGIEVLMAEKYSADLSKRIRKGMDATVEKGLWCAIPPIGYTVRNPQTKVLEVDPVRAPFVKLAFELKAKGKSVEEITEILYRKGFRSRKLGTKFPGNQKYVRSKVHKMLRESGRFYYGEFSWNGRVYKGTHKPLITKELWQAAQDSFAVLKSARPAVIAKFPFNGLMKCGICGCSVIGTLYKQKRYERYHCSQAKFKHKCAYISPEELADMFHKQLALIKLPAEAFKIIKKHLTDSVNGNDTITTKAVKRLETERKGLSERISRLYDDRVDNKISEEFWQRKQSEYQALLADIEKQLAGLSSSFSTTHIKEGLWALELIKSLLPLYNSLTLPKKAKLLSILHLNGILIQRNLTISQLSMPFSLFFPTSTSKSLKWWRRWDLNPRPDLLE